MSKVTQNRSARAFVIGRSGFASISAVEGIRISKSVSEDLRKLASASPAKRRSTLVARYGKR